MRKALLLGLALSLVFTGAFAHYPGKISINAAQKKQGPVPFDHAKHGDTYVKDCTTCHHMEKGLTKAKTDTMQVRKCSTCHMKVQGKLATMTDMSLTKNPMHVTCVGCHKTQKKGPTACTGCHKKG